MNKQFWVIGLACLLLLQVAVYLDSQKEQRKEVRVPEVEMVETKPAENQLRGVAVAVDTQANPISFAAEAPLEQLTFVSNPSTEYYRINPDYVGWLTVAGTIIDYPVVRGEDNETYLTRNFYQEEDVLGAIFMDYRNIGMGLDKHTIIYGHYTQHGQMFRELEYYLSEEFLHANPEFTYKDAHQERRYKIFSVHVAPAETSFLAVDFEDGAYPEFLQTLKDSSLLPVETEVAPEDRILTLVTCNFAVEDGRLFIHAVEITE